MMKWLLLILVIFPQLNCFAVETTPDDSKARAALEHYLDQYGDYCLGKYDWPIEVSDVHPNAPNAIQMLALEKAGIVELSSDSSRHAEQSEHTKTYTLTEMGTKYFIKKAILENTQPLTTDFRKDLCVGKIKLRNVEHLEVLNINSGHQEILISYTYEFLAPEWVLTKDIQIAFPMLSKVLKGSKNNQQLQQRFSWLKGELQAIGP